MSTVLHCIKHYFHDSSKAVLTTTVRSLGSDEKGRFARLVETIFHPQGGGQPFDIGTIGKFSVTRVEKEGTPTDFDIKHYYDGEGDLEVGQEVECRVDMDRRKINARLHSAGHLIAAVAEFHLPGIKAVAGHHVPGECRVEFEKTTQTAEELKETLSTNLQKIIDSNLSVAVIFDPEGKRTIKIGDYPAVGCGGTHVNSLAEIGQVTLKSINVKSGKLRVSYE
jgi:alanyl-tRNA synthetase